MKRRKYDPIRAIAWELLCDVVIHGRSLSTQLPDRLMRVERPEDRAFLQELVYGVLRWGVRLQSLVDQMMRVHGKTIDWDLRLLLMMAIYQIEYLRVPDHAAVSTTVDLSQHIGQARVAGFINANLRGYLREAESIRSPVDTQEWRRYAHPKWMSMLFQKDWSTQASALLQANNARAPMFVRVNPLRSTRQDYRERLEACGLAASDCAWSPWGLEIKPVVEAQRLPAYETGDVTVQDQGAQMAVPLLKLAPGLNVLDACAAPGGKTTQIFELCPEIACLVVVEQDPGRMHVLTENLKRVGIASENNPRLRLVIADASQSSAWEPDMRFDRILLDAPCSGSGVLRRHPDIKFLRREQDIAALQARQRALLTALWPRVAPGGLLLYSTCSVFKAENEEIIRSFLEAHGDAVEDPIDVSWGQACDPGRQILTGEAGMDGFYFARLRRV